jgi:uncharacterized protein YegP (UPF0339 family)
MGEVRFRSRPAASGDDGFTFATSPDGLAFTLEFSDLHARVKPGSPPAVVRVFSVVLPVDGADNGADIRFVASGFAGTEEGTSGTAVLGANGQSSAERFPAGADGSFEQVLLLEAGPTAEVRLSVVVVAERDADHPDGGADVSVMTVNAEVQPRGAGRFELVQGASGKFHFNLVAPNGEVVVTSEGYESKAGAVNAIESVKRNSEDAPVVDQTGS